MNIYNKHQKKTELITEIMNILDVWDEYFEYYKPSEEAFEKDYYNACMISLQADKVEDKDFINALPLLIQINIEEEGYFKPLILRIKKLNGNYLNIDQKKALMSINDRLIFLEDLINNRNQEDMITML